MIRGVVFWVLWALPVAAQELGGLARVAWDRSQVEADAEIFELTLDLSQPVPYRVFFLDEPRRLVLDFNEVSWAGSEAGLRGFFYAEDAMRVGAFRPGWTRMVVDLEGALKLEQAGMQVDAATGRAVLRVVAAPTDADSFAEGAGAPVETGIWAELSALDRAPITETMPTDQPVIVIDPGHGGIDPGAERGGLVEADLMLQLAIDLAEVLNRTGVVTAVLTRESDTFVSLNARDTLARSVGAALFISLHADALEDDDVTSGASVYTLSQQGTARAAQRMAERHERGDLLAGLDLTENDDRVASVLMDLARRETAPQADRFADQVIAALREGDARVNSNPRREGRLAVLSAADYASVLIETGFLSNAADRAALASEEGRARIVRALTAGVLRWVADEQGRAPLVRQ